MKKEYVVSVEITQEIQKALEEIRWKHLDIEKIIGEELQEWVKTIILAYGE